MCLPTDWLAIPESAPNFGLLLQERMSTGSQASVVALADLTQGELRQQLQPADYNVPAQRFGLPVGETSAHTDVAGASSVCGVRHTAHNVCWVLLPASLPMAEKLRGVQLAFMVRSVSAAPQFTVRTGPKQHSLRVEPLDPDSWGPCMFRAPPTGLCSHVMCAVTSLRRPDTPYLPQQAAWPGCIAWEQEQQQCFAWQPPVCCP